MTHGFQIDEALADGFRLIRRRPVSVFAWGVVLTLPVLLSAIVMIDLLMTIGLEAMAENADASPQALAALRGQLADAPSAQIQFERDGQVRSTTVRTRP